MLNAIIEFFESIGRARAAAVLAQAGRPDLAKQLMLPNNEQFEVHP